MKKGEKERKNYIYFLFKQTQRRCVTIFFTWERGERVRKSSWGREQRKPREKEPLGWGLDVRYLPL